jgi:PAS domain S-box-containing protein
MLDLAGDAIIDVDPEQCVTYWNMGAERIFGWPQGEAIGKNAYGLLQAVFPSPREQIQAQCVRDGYWQGEVEVIRRDGTRITLDSRWTLHQKAGAPAVLLLINTDISERKLLESQLRQAQKMEAIGRLVGGIAHDFNNLLTIIVGYSQLLQESTRDEKIRASVTQIFDTGMRAAALTHQLLAFSRKQVLQPRVLSIKELLSNMGKMLARVIGEDIKLAVHSATDLGMVKADPGQLEQVVLNLVINARDAMPHGGHITIETTNLDLDELYARQHIGSHAGPFVMLTVSDTGTGMDAATRAQIYEPFFTTKNQESTGLGLSTVYGIVKQSGGYILVYSEVGRGTTFKIYLPRVDEPAEAIQQAQPKETSGSETILLVEDEQAVRELICQVLAMKGYRVLDARNGEEAIAIWDRYSETIHLTITDVIMPGITGDALSDILRSRNPNAKILYMSGYTAAAIADGGILSVNHAFLQKPVTVNALLQKVREVLDS